MKTDILKALRRLRLPALALAAFLASCTSELAHEPAPGGGSQAGEALVTLRLQVPGAAAAGRTRAVGDNAERTVNDLYILAFKVDPDTGNETFDYYAVARKGTEDLTTGVSKWTASLRPKDYEQTFVMIANAQGTPGDVNTQIAALVDDGAGGTSVGEDKETVLEKLTDKLTADEQTAGFNAKGDNDHHPFTMYGQTAATKIELGKDVSLTVALHRIVARVNVAFTGDAQANFTAEKVYLCNFTDRARVIPNGLDQTTGTDYEPAATIPADAQKLPAAFDALGNIPTYMVTANEVKNQIYLFETNQPAPDDADAHLKRPCLVVQGTYEGYEGYYRVDFATQDATTGDVTYRDIIRNHSYNFTVTNVSGRGSATLQEAMETKASNLTADMILWDDNVIGNIDFEGDRVLGISTNSYELIKSGGIRLLQVRATKNVTWTANIYAANADGSADVNGARPAWIYFTNEGGTDNNGTTLADQTGIDALQDIYFKVDANDESRERQAVVRLTDEKNRLSVEALVTQNLVEIPVSLTVTQNGVPVTEMEFTGEDGTSLGSIFINYGPKDVVLTWTIEEDPANGTMDIADVDINTTSTGGQLEGEVIAATDNAQTVLNATAAPLSAEDLAKSFATRTATLTLIAQHPTTGEVQVQTIRLFQKKYGLEIDRTEVLCGGQEALIYVKGNMPWQVVNISGQGYQDAMTNGLISEYTVMDEGDPSETSFSTSSCVRISTKQAPLIRESHKAQLNFQHRTQADKAVSKEITFRGGMLAVGSGVYEVYGPVNRSLNTKNDPYLENGTEVQGAVMMNGSQASALQNAVPGLQWGICLDSGLLHEYHIEQGDETIYKSIVSDAGFTTVIPTFFGQERQLVESVTMTYAGPIGSAVLESQNLLSLTMQGAPEHTYMRVVAANGNLGPVLDITTLGYGRTTNWGYEFIEAYKNVTWAIKEGAFGLPCSIYGETGSAKASPNIRHDYVNQGYYNAYLARYGVASALETEKHKATEYQTYYFKPTN
ncbi:putative lipoprotein [Bacteroides fragilis str. S23L24]|nr:putative lipoprotein [Bacteroides fragilis str. S23L24]